MQFFYEKSFPRHEEYIGFVSKINQIVLNYYHPDKYNELFTAIKWLSKAFLKIVDIDNFYSILIRILLEQSFIFISDNIEYLTTMVLGFSYFIQPFKWPFILIPNLPLDLINVVESPVPYLIGILGDKNLKNNFINASSNTSNIVTFHNNKFELIIREKLTCQEPYLKNLKIVLKNNLDNAQYYIKTKKYDEYNNYCEMIYKNVYESMKSGLADEIETLIKSNLYVNLIFFNILDPRTSNKL